jgi:peptide/nickel transport system ATP-binding protein
MYPERRASRDRSISGYHHAVKDVDLVVRPGEIVAVVGQSGSGKSTLVNAILHLLPRSALSTAHEIRFDAQDLPRLRERQWREIRGKAIGYVPQDPTVSLDPVKTIGSQLSEMMLTHGAATRETVRERAIALLEEVGITLPAQRLSQYPHEFSGGMQQRVLIAIALCCHPRLVIADEPTSGLDVTVQKRILDKLSALVRERNTAVLFITHDLSVAADRAHRVLVMNEGRVVEQGLARQILHAPTHPYTQALVDAIPGRHGRTRDDEEDPRGEALPILTVEKLSKTYESGWLRGNPPVVAVDDVSFSLMRGRTLAVVGESGSGKTTLARMLAGLVPASSGTVRYEQAEAPESHDGGGLAAPTQAGRRGSQGSARTRTNTRSIQFVYQNPYRSLNPLWTIASIIADPLRVNRIGDRASQQARVRELVDAVGLPATLLERQAGELSGGQLQRVAIARALALNPEVLILDEPVSALDVIVQARIMALLIRLQTEYQLTYLFISHDLAVVREIAHHVLVMKGGRTVEYGPVQSVFTRPASEYARTLLNAIPGNAASAPERQPQLVHLREQALEQGHERGAATACLSSFHLSKTQADF